MKIQTRLFRRGDLGSIEQDEFEDMVIASLHLLGGSGRRQVIIEYILKTFGSQFKEFDYELLESQKPPKERWIHNVDWARKKLVENGLLRKATDSPYGTWVLTEKGRTEALNL